ncbi:integrase core domain-containing protein [Nocardia sp. NBC_01329]|uniref:integrase core domain-containing protein n=1 Tax=Nocardia sp. NBC_01329 TaxID=2903594 RepID=UPI003FA3DD45
MKHQGHGFRRAWAAPRFDEGSGVNIKKVHRLWREEGLQVREHHPRKRAGVSSVPPVEADAPKVLWALDFQFDSAVDGIRCAATVLRRQVGMYYIPPGTPWNNGFIESFNRRLRTECLNRNHWTSLLEARVVIGDFKNDHNARNRHPALGYRTPAEYAAGCAHTHHPVACGVNRTRNDITWLWSRVDSLSGTAHALLQHREGPKLSR